jgi:acetyltransferase-like isoleucine patch superfamily enzyme
VGATWVELPASASASIDVSQLPHGVAISTTLDSASVSLSLTPAVADPNRPGPHYVDPSASISPQVDSLGRGCTIEENVTIGADAVIGPSATIADGADVGVGAVVGAKASIGSNTQISSDSFVSSSTVLGDGVTIGAGAVVGEGTVIHSGAVVEADARIGANTVIGKGTTISTNARVGSDVYVGSQVLVGSDVVVPDGYKIAHGTNQANSIARCIRDDGTIEFRSLPASSWSPSSPPVAIQSDDGVISGPSQPTPLGLTTSSSTVSAPHDVVNPSTPPGGIGNLHNDIGNTIAPPSGGGTGHPYNHPYLCGWFAEQLRRRLAGLHYNTTFTCVWTKNPKARWYNRQRPWIDGHALVDIHWPDGTTSWIEAQLANGRGIDTRTPDLDGNGDGRVTAWDGKHKSKATDGNKRIEIYGSRAEAEAAGCSIPGN